MPLLRRRFGVRRFGDVRASTSRLFCEIYCQIHCSGDFQVIRRFARASRNPWWIQQVNQQRKRFQLSQIQKMKTSTPIDMKNITPLVTGGGGGIGLGLVKEFLMHGSPKVLITGRHEDALKEVANDYRGKVFYKVNDAGIVADRLALLEWIKKEHSDCNALVNNAGIQRRVPLVKETVIWEDRVNEIEINLHAPIHLCALFTPYFLEKNEMTILANVSSELAFYPMVGAPVYSATKAAIHNFTLSLRYSLEDTNIRVIEIVPPLVQSNLGGWHDAGENLDEYVAATMRSIEAGKLEVGFNSSEKARQADRVTLDGMMDNFTAMTQAEKYPPKKWTVKH
jgi:uncharacterized oxidoreductase